MAKRKTSRKKGKPKRAAAARGQGTRARGSWRPLREWGLRTLQEHGLRLAPHIAILRGGGVVEAYRVPDYLPQGGAPHLAMMLAVLARTAEPGELTAQLSQANLGGERFQIDPRTGLASGDHVVLVGRALAPTPPGLTNPYVFAWHRNKLRTTATTLAATEGSLPPDWTRGGFPVDPVLENALAAKGFPGAVASARGIVPLREAERPLERQRAPRERERQATDESSTVGTLETWAAAKGDGVTVTRLRLRTWLPGLPPLQFASRPVLDLLEDAAGDPQALLWAARRVSVDAEPVPALEQLLAQPSVTARAKRYAVALVLESLPMDDGEATRWQADLEERFDEAFSEAGGAIPWLRERWPAAQRLEVGELVRTVDLAGAAHDAEWRVCAAQTAASLRAAPDVEARVDAALAHATQVRETLLALLGATTGSPSDAIAALAVEVLGRDDAADGRLDPWERELKRWRILAPERAFRLVVAFAVARLHSQLAVLQILTHDRRRDGAFRPELLEATGLLGFARRALAIALLAEALKALASGAPERAAELADCALRAASWERGILACANEIRFWAGVRSPELARDLSRESREALSLGVEAERLRVAEALADPRAERVALRRLARCCREARSNDPPAARWAARALLVLRRAGPDCDAEMAALSSSAPAIDEASALRRAVFALLGDSAAEGVAELQRSLAAMQEAWEAAELLRLYPVEAARLAADDAVAELAPLPVVGVGPSVAGEMLEALSQRSGALGWESTEHADRLEAHQSRAAELVGYGGPEVAEWVGAARELARLLELGPGHARGVRGALRGADRALEPARIATWRQGVLEGLGLLESALGGRGDDAARALRAEGRSLATGLDELGDLKTREAHAERVAELLEQASSLGRDGGPGEDAPTESVEVDSRDRFQPMTLAPGALERSRTQLGAAEWVIQVGLRQMQRYNLARGRRDLKMLKGHRGGSGGALWELRHRDRRHPVRVIYRLRAHGPVVVGIFGKRDDAHQRRLLALLEPDAGAEPGRG